MKAVTAAEMAALDRRATEECGIPVARLMENAGKAAAEEIAEFIEKKLKRSLTAAWPVQDRSN